MTKRIGRFVCIRLECNDKKTKRQKKDMAKMLEKLIMSLNRRHYLTFAGTWEPDRKLFEKGDYLAALAKSKRLERMVVILRVHDISVDQTTP